MSDRDYGAEHAATAAAMTQRSIPIDQGQAEEHDHRRGRDVERSATIVIKAR